jgi:integrase
MSVRKREWVTRKGEAREAFIVDYVDQEGNRHIRTFDRKGDATDYSATVKVAIRQGVHSNSKLTVAEAAEAWIKRVEADGAERTTIRQYRQHIRLHIVPRIGRTRLSELHHGSVEKFRDDLLKNLSRPMSRKVLTSLKSLLRAAKHGHVAADVKIKRNPREKRVLEVGRDIPTPAEIKRMIAAATAAAGKDKGRARALLLVTALAGPRASELRGLRWSPDIDLKAGELHVRQRADRYKAIGHPKSKAAVRTIPLAPEAVSALKEWKLACPKGEAGLVFPTSAGQVEHHKNMLRNLEPILKDAGVVNKAGKPKYALHALRHFFASWCINPKSRGGRALPAKAVQELMGHSSIVITLDLYGHLFPRGDDHAELAEAASALLA